MLKGTSVLMWAALTPFLFLLCQGCHMADKAQGLLCCDHVGTTYLV